MHYVRRNESGQHERSQVAMHAAIITMTTDAPVSEWARSRSFVRC